MDTKINNNLDYNSVNLNTIKCENFLKSCNNYFYLNISVDYLEVIYKQCDDFGTIFKPFLEIKIIGQENFKVPIVYDDKINNSDTSYDNNGNMITKSNINSKNKEKKYYFNDVNYN